MELSFIRTERTAKENQERAYIAASRRKDRNFKERLLSLKKASDVHFERTGKRYQLTLAQIASPGPVMEDLRRVNQGSRGNRRFQPYPQGRQDRKIEDVSRSHSSQASTINSTQTLTQGTINPEQIQYQPPEQEITAPMTMTIIPEDIFNGGSGYKTHLFEFEDAFHASENVELNTNQPEMSKPIEGPLYDQEAPSFPFFSDSWRTFREPGFEDLMAFEDFSQLPSIPEEPREVIFQEPATRDGLTQLFEDTNSLLFNRGNPNEITFEHIEDVNEVVRVAVEEKRKVRTDKEDN